MTPEQRNAIVLAAEALREAVAWDDEHDQQGADDEYAEGRGPRYALEALMDAGLIPAEAV